MTTQPVVSRASLDPRNAEYVIRQCSNRACDGCIEWRVRRHGDRTGTKERDHGCRLRSLPAIPSTWPHARGAALPVMMLLTGTFRVALVTTHLSLSRRAARHYPGASGWRHCALCTCRLASGISTSERPPHPGPRAQSHTRAKRVTSAGKKSTSSNPCSQQLRAVRASHVRGPHAGGHGVRASISRKTPMSWLPCITIRACRF